MAETQVKGINVGDRTIIHLDIDLSSAPLKSPLVAGDKFAIVDSVNNLTSIATLSAVKTFLDTYHAPASGSGNYIQNQNAAAQSANMWISGDSKASTFSIYNPTAGPFSDTDLGGISWFTHYGLENKTRIFAFGKNGSLYPDLRFSTNYETKLIIDGLSGAATFASTIQATTAKFTNLTDGYIPYHVSDASGLGNSVLNTNGSFIRVGSSSLTFRFSVNTGIDQNFSVAPPTNLISGITVRSTNDNASLLTPIEFRSSLYGFLGGGNVLINTTTDNLTDKLQVNGSVQATTAKLTNLTDGYLPYHISDASGLGDSLLYVLNNNELIVGNNTYYSSTGGHSKISNWSNGGLYAGYSAGQFENNPNGVTNYMLKSRGTTVGSHGLVLNADVISFTGYEASDGVAWKRGAVHRISVDGTASLNIVPMRFTWDTMNAAGTLAERMSLTAEGRLNMTTDDDNPLRFNRSTFPSWQYTSHYQNNTRRAYWGMTPNSTFGFFKDNGSFIEFSGSNIVMGTYPNTDNGVDKLQVIGSINSTGYRKDAVTLRLDPFKSGSQGASGTILVSTGASTDATWKTLADAGIAVSGHTHSYTSTRIQGNAYGYLSGDVTIQQGDNISVTQSGSTITVSMPVSFEPSFAKNTAFNKNFGDSTGTVLEGRTFGTAANSAATDFAAAVHTHDYSGIFAAKIHSHNYDNYGGWSLLVNSTGATSVLSGGTVNFIQGTNISLSKSGNDITINMPTEFAAAIHTHAYDNYGSWTLQANGGSGTGITSGSVVNIIQGTNISISKSGNNLTVNMPTSFEPELGSPSGANYFLTTNGTSRAWINENTIQATLVSGTNIKTINGASILGSGDLTVGGSAAHAITSHTDVAFTYSPSSGDIMQFNGTAWTQRSLPTAGIAALAGSTSQVFGVQRLNLPGSGYIEVQGSTIHIYSGASNVVVHGTVTADAFYKN